MAMNLGMLGFFKYYNFFVNSAQDLVSLLSANYVSFSSSSLSIILPVGISFYTFQTMSYTIDVYRRKIQPEKSLINFGLFVSFFPQLIAGPIERSRNLLPQIKKKRYIAADDIYSGLFYILWGLILKVFLADNMASISDPIFNSTESVTGMNGLIGTYAFAFQIYGDFAGYSLMAKGLAAMFAIELKTNFLFPYFSSNPQQFWRRWHISLSEWLRDYVYKPLGGSKRETIITYRNLMLTMLIGGIWHGSSYNFLVWGCFHGFLLVCYRFFKGYLPTSHNNPLIGKPLQLISIIFFFNIVCFGWIFFRATNIQSSFSLIQAIFYNFAFDEVYWSSVWPKFAVTLLPIFIFECFQYW